MLTRIQHRTSNSGHRAAKVAQEGKIRVWDLAGSTLVAEMAVPGAVEVNPGSLSAAGDRLVVVRKDRSAAVVEVPSGKVLTQLPAAEEQEGRVGVAISPDGRWAAAASLTPGRLTVYDAATGKPARELRPVPSESRITHRWPMFTPDGKKLLCLSAWYSNAESWGSGWLHCWDASTGRPLFSRNAGQFTGGPGLAIRADSRQAAWPVADGTVQLIDLDTGETEQTLRIGPPGGVIPGVAYAPDGRHLVTANGNGTDYVLRIPPSPVEATDVTGSDWLDLLQLPADACEVRPGDPWVKRDETWTVARVPAEQAQMAFPVVPRGGYDLRTQVSLREGNDCLLFALPVGLRSVILGFNHNNGTIAGLSNIGGVQAHREQGNASTVKHQPIQVGKKINVVRPILARMGRYTTEGEQIHRFNGVLP